MQQGRASEGLDLIAAAARSRPGAMDILSNLAAAQLTCRQFEAALSTCETILAQEPQNPFALDNSGVALLNLGRHDEAIARFDRILSLEPGRIRTLLNRANALAALRRYDDALAAYDAVLRLAPSDIDALNNKGNVLSELRRYDEALASYTQLLSVRPDYLDGLNNRGNVLSSLGRYEEALVDYARLLTGQPDNVIALYNSGEAFRCLHRYQEAAAAFQRALTLKPDYVEAYGKLALVMRMQYRLNEALAIADQGLAIKADDANLLYLRGNIASRLGRTEQAEADLAAALARDPNHPAAFGELMWQRLLNCAWTSVREGLDQLLATSRPTGEFIPPLLLLGLIDDPERHFEFASRAQGSAAPALSAPRPEPVARDRIRVAYLSADFHIHPTAFLTAELFEQHDRCRFEIIGISYGPDDGSDIRARIKQGLDVFHDVSSLADDAAANLLRSLSVDVAVSLKGHTDDARLNILTTRPAGVQAQYLGYPGTTGAPFIDYVIADPFVLPFDQQAFYSEKIVHLPDCYQVNDRKRDMGGEPSSRAALGLPDHGFVFGCFNASWKISEATFDLWMRILNRVPGSVLWLLESNAVATKNLRNAAESRGVRGDRLIFADRTDFAAHMARYRRMDLFLDTLPYNAHTTASDALWMGVPVLSCSGRAFASRVGGSLLHAAGLPELSVTNLSDCEEQAVALAMDSGKLGTLKARLQQNRLSCPLFDSQRFARHIEAAYARMVDLWRKGQAPQSFSVERIS